MKRSLCREKLETNPRFETSICLEVVAPCRASLQLSLDDIPGIIGFELTITLFSIIGTTRYSEVSFIDRSMVLNHTVTTIATITTVARVVTSIALGLIVAGLDIPAIGAIVRLVNTNDPSVESATCIRRLCRNDKMKSGLGPYSWLFIACMAASA